MGKTTKFDLNKKNSELNTTKINNLNRQACRLLPIICFGCSGASGLFIDYMHTYGFEHYFYIEYFVDDKHLDSYKDYDCKEASFDNVKGKIVLITKEWEGGETAALLDSWGLRKNCDYFIMRDLLALFIYRQSVTNVDLPTLRVSFENFGDIPSDIFIFALTKYYRVILDNDNPDVVMASVFGEQTKSKNSISFLYTGENTRPDLMNYDYNIGFDYYDDYRYLRWPLYYLYTDSYIRTISAHKGIELDEFMQRSFASRVVSKNKSEFRERFFEMMNAHKYVASGGKLKNNLSNFLPVKDKMAFIRKYKFNIAFENVSHPGYVTEKIVHAFAAGCIPIYWGDNTIEEQFNKEAFVNVTENENMDELINRIIDLSENRDVIEKMLMAHKINKVIDPLNELSVFLYNSISRGNQRR